MPCRAKKAKCSGDKPTCSNCDRFRLECTWPEGRKRKRTRKEMEADFGKRPAPGATEAAGPSFTTQTGPKAVTSDPTPTERSESTTSASQVFADRRPSEMTQHPFVQQEVTQPSLNAVGFEQDPLLSQSMRFGNGQSFSPQARNSMFFPHAAATGHQLHQPHPPIDELQPLSGTSRMNTGSAGAGTPHTIWQFLASLPAHDSLLPTYREGDDPLQMQLSGLNARGDGPVNPYPQYPMANEQQYLPQQQHQIQQNQQLVAAAHDFLQYNPPSASEKRSNVGTGKEPQTEAQKAPSDSAGSKMGTPSMSGLMKAITNQIGYLEGDESKPYLKLSYFRVAGSTCEFLPDSRRSTRLKANVGSRAAWNQQDMPQTSSQARQSDGPRITQRGSWRRLEPRFHKQSFAASAESLRICGIRRFRHAAKGNLRAVAGDLFRFAGAALPKYTAVSTFQAVGEWNDVGFPAERCDCRQHRENEVG